MTAHSNRINNDNRGSIEDQDPLLLSYAKWIGDPDSLYPVPRPGLKTWVMRCPLPGHSGRVRTFVIDLVSHQWLCTVCAVGGDVVDLAAKLNRFGRRDAERIIAIHRERMTRSANRYE